MTRGMEPITAFLKNMKFKTKLMGGYDREGVLDNVEALTQLYQTYIEELQLEVKQAEETAEVLRRELHEIRTLGDSLKKQLSAVPAGKGEYETNARLLEAALLRQEKEREAILVQAQREAKKLLIQAEDQVQALVIKRRREAKEEITVLQNKAEQVRQELQSLEQERSTSMFEMRTALHLIRQDLSHMAGNIDGLVEKMDQPKRDGRTEREMA